MLMQVDSVIGYGYIIKKQDIPPQALTIKDSPYFYRICERCGESEYFLGIVVFKCNSRERYRILNLNTETLHNVRARDAFIEQQYREIMNVEPTDIPTFVMFTQMTKVK